MVIEDTKAEANNTVNTPAPAKKMKSFGFCTPENIKIDFKNPSFSNNVGSLTNARKGPMVDIPITSDIAINTTKN